MEKGLTRKIKGMVWVASSPSPPPRMKARKVSHFSACPQGIKMRLVVAAVSYADVNVNYHKDIILNGNVNKLGIYR